MGPFTLFNDEGIPTEFNGWKLAHVSSRTFKPDAERWSELTLFGGIKGGALACQEAGHSNVPGEVTRYRLINASSARELIHRVGYGWLAKKLYDAAGIDHAIEIGTSANGGHTLHLASSTGPDVRCSGSHSLTVSTDRPAPHQRDRWSELHLYCLNDGSYVCHELGCSRIEGELTRQHVICAKDPQELMRQLGNGRLAKELYAKMETSAA